MFGTKPRLPIDLILRTREDSLSKFHYKVYLESWENMEGVSDVALIKSSGWKGKDVLKKLKSGPCLGFLEPGDKVWVRNLLPRGDPGKLKPF